MGDERLKAVLKRAAEDPEFMRHLGIDREATVDGLNLSDSEKAMLKSVPLPQLDSMVNNARSIWNRRIPCAGAGCLLGGVVLASMLMPTLGHTAERAQESHAVSNLKQLALAQVMYKEEYSCYGDLSSLRRKEPEFFEHLDNQDYVFKVEFSEDGFLITAIHKSKATKRKSFKVGPDLKVEVIQR